MISIKSLEISAYKRSVIVNTAFVLYIFLIVASCFVIKFGKSFCSSQYYTTCLMGVKWEESPLIKDREGEGTPREVHVYTPSRSQTLLKCCVLSSVLYANPYNYGKGLRMFQDSKTIKVNNHVKKPVVFGYVAKCDGYFVIALKPTANLDDVFLSSNKRLYQTKNFGRIHRGYLRQSLEAMFVIVDYISQFPDTKTIFVTGHSLGGSLATVIGTLLSKNRDYQISVYAFGSVKVGAKDHAQYVDSSPNFSVHNILNEHDQVIYSPKSEEYTRCGDQILFRNNRGSFQKNHSIKAYKTFVEGKPLNSEKHIESNPGMYNAFFKYILNAF